MPDLMSIISANYVAVGQQVIKPGKYVNVDPEMYQGTWRGKYADGTRFAIQVSNVDGFRAKVKYEHGSTTKYQDVLIKDSSFRVADSKFTLAANGRAQVKTILTNSSTGKSTLETATALR